MIIKVTGYRHNVGTKKDGKTYDTFVVTGETYESGWVGQCAQRYYIDTAFLGGVVPEQGSVLLLDTNARGYVQSVAFLPDDKLMHANNGTASK